MLNTPFAPWPSFSLEEAEAVSNVLLSNRVNYWTGAQGREFEREFSLWCGSKHSIAVANGTVALELALKALGIGEGDEVIVTPRSFIASVSCVVSVGATPVFADVDRSSGNLTAETILNVLTPRTKAVVLVHLAGWPCDMDPIMDIARSKGLKVIEDCAQAHGARYKGRSVGTIGHVGAWSFCQDKILTTGGEGGMVTTNDDAVFAKVWSLKDHGKSLSIGGAPRRGHGFQWIHESFGGNGRMLEMQSAIGRLQLKRLSEWSDARCSNAQRILQTCSKHAIARVPAFRCCSEKCPEDCAVFSGCRHAYYKCYVYIKPSALASGWTRDRIIAEINADGVPCYHGSCPEIYLEKAFDGVSWRPEKRLAIAKELGETSIMFLVHPTLKEQEISFTCNTIDKVFASASRS